MHGVVAAGNDISDMEYNRRGRINISSADDALTLWDGVIMAIREFLTLIRYRLSTCCTGSASIAEYCTAQ